MARTRLTDEEIDAQIADAEHRTKEEDGIEPRVASAGYNPETGRIDVELKNGCMFSFPPREGRGLEEATADQLAEVTVTPSREGLHWKELDADISLPGLMLRLLNVRAWAGKYLGSSTSEAKARAARENGKKGGRPRKRKAG